MEESLRVKLGIKSGDKVCLFHSRKDLLSMFMQGDLKLMLDWAEDNCDTILYWLQPKDDVKDIMVHLERQIKRSGRIWLITKEQDDENIQRIVLEATSLVNSKTMTLGNGERGVQYMFRKAARDEKRQSEDNDI